jgi:very-short-patch-repair endonuclease
MRRRARFGVLVFEKPGAAGDKLGHARAMRARPTAAEAALWSALRDRRLDGWKFRRQHVIAGYIVDFYCAKLWLAVEVDGPVHETRRIDDRERDDNLALLGVRMVRLRNADVLERLDCALEQLAHRCQHIAEQHGIVRGPHPLRGGGHVRAARETGGGGR